MTDKKQPDQNKILFVNMVSMLTMSAMHQLGKIINPATGKAETSLEGAQATIDMLDMLSAKTRGNLDEEEGKMLADTLTMLKLNYVETSKMAPADGQKTRQPDGEKSSAAAKQPADAGAPKTGAGSAPAGTGQPQSEPKPPSSDAKFHKSYG